jgi:phosphatidylglycerol:prolipoprotein diacylglycerol transferase
MWPRIGPLPTYAVCYTAAFLLAYVVYWQIARLYALSWRVWLPVSILSSIAGVVGSKILYDLLHPPCNWQALLTVEHYVHGGYWGGLLASLSLAVPAAWLLAPRKRAALDLVALVIPLLFILAKLGCFCNGCCYGRPCALPWAVVFPPGSRHAPAGIPVHPTQLYEIVGILAFLWVFRRLDRRRWQGTMLLWFLAIEGATVATCECFRGDFQQHVCLGPVTLSQLLALIAATVSLVLLIVWARRFPPAPNDSAVASFTHG